jgi:hypothetical protein
MGAHYRFAAAALGFVNGSLSDAEQIPNAICLSS